MTQEEKANAYDEALERARNLHKDATDMEEGILAKQCEIIFPELLESEDERIRNTLIRFHKSTIDIDGIKGDEIVSWLEKQGTSYTKRDVDGAYVEGVAFAKNELEKQKVSKFLLILQKLARMSRSLLGMKEMKVILYIVFAL